MRESYTQGPCPCREVFLPQPCHRHQKPLFFSNIFPFKESYLLHCSNHPWERLRCLIHTYVHRVYIIVEATVVQQDLLLVVSTRVLLHNFSPLLSRFPLGHDWVNDLLEFRWRLGSRSANVRGSSCWHFLSRKLNKSINFTPQQKFPFMVIAAWRRMLEERLCHPQA